MKRSLEERFLRRGRDYFNRGKVCSVDVGGEGLLIGRVGGSGRQVYSVLAHVRKRGAALHVGGACTCPVGGDCKHVAAVLYHYLAHQPDAPPAAEREAPLSPDALGWLAGLERLAAKPDAVKSDEHIVYLLGLSAKSRGMELRVEVMTARTLRSGRLGGAKRFTEGYDSTACFVTDEDRRLLLALEARREQVSQPSVLRGFGSQALLAELIATGRCRWERIETPPLSWGEPLESNLTWRAGADGSLRIGVEADMGLVPLSTQPPAAFDPIALRCVPLITPFPDPAAAALAGAPVLSVEQAGRFGDALGRAMPEAPRPTPVERVVRDDVRPVPCLHLYSENLGTPDDEEWIECGELHFEYAGLPVHPYDEEPATRCEAQRLEVIPRRWEEEERALDRLASIGLMPDDFMAEGDRVALVPADESDRWAWVRLMAEGLPRLRSEGWRVDIDPSFRMRTHDPDGWYGGVEEGGSGGWFDLELGVEVEGRRINLLPVLAEQLADERRAEALRRLTDDGFLLVPLEEGGVVRIPAGRVRRLVEVLIELYDPESLAADRRLRLNRLQAPRLLELDEGSEIAWEGERALREYGRKLAGFKGIRPVKPPRGLNAELRPYQREGLNWLQFLRQYELGGVLADDMGLGKTVQSLAHLLKEKEARRADRPSLVVAPTSLMVNWRREAERFTPGLKVLTLHGPGRKAHFDAIGDHDLVLTTYPLLVRDLEALSANPYHLLILDEAQQIKNPKAKAWSAARSLEARHRLALTGTPMENHLGELWSLFDQLLPGYLGESRRFAKLFRTPIEKHGDAERHAALRRRTAPFMLRREKGEVVAELPPKSEIVSEVELEGGQRDLYETLRVSMSKRVREEIANKGLARSHITILDALLKLRQACCDPRLLKIDGAKKVKESAKLDQLMELLPEMVEEGRRILLFSQFTSMLGLIEAELKKHRLGYVKLTGQTRDRTTPVDRFQAGEVPIFLISLKAGGSGLNLTAADTVIHYDPWWNPAVERQATDRAHRIGQEKPVFVYKLIARGTVEERIAAMQARKRELAESLFAEGGKGLGALSGEELQALFEPLDGRAAP